MPFESGPAATALLMALFVFGLGPPLLTAAAIRAQYRQRLRRATLLRRLACVLRPTKGHRFAVDLSTALEHAAAGDLEQARRLLESWPPDSSQGRFARLQLLRFEGEWAQLRSHAQGAPGGPLAVLRASGELSDTEAFAATWREHARALGHFALRDTAWLYLFAFGGRPDLVATLLSSRLPAMAREPHDFWLATARLASGDASARSLLEPLTRCADATLRSAARWRLAHGPFAPLVSETVIDSQVTLLQQALRYGRNRARGVPRMTLVMCFSLLFAFGIQLGLGAGDDIERLLVLGALFPPDVVVEGEWWRTMAYAWLHSGAAHLSVNVLALLPVGAWVEHNLGRWRWLGVYLVSAVGAGLVAVFAWWHGLTEARAIVGASGAVMGLVGATGAVLLRGMLEDKAVVARRGFVVVVAVVLFQTLFDLLMPNVSMLTHVAGLSLGFVSGLVLSARPRPNFVAPSRVTAP